MQFLKQDIFGGEQRKSTSSIRKCFCRIDLCEEETHLVSLQFLLAGVI